MRKVSVVVLLATCMMVASAGMVMAASSVAWIAPPNNSMFCVGTMVNPSGQASGSGAVGGTGLDLMFVIDRSGSMSGAGITNAKNAANSLINALPKPTTQGGLASFNSSATLDQQLLSLALPANVATLQAKVNGLVASGGTTIGTGITVATTELTGPRAVAGHSKMQVVLSDGYSSGTPQTQAAQAAAQGITVHAVGVPGHDAAQMQAIATAGGGVYTNVTDLAYLESIFNGTGGNLVALDHLDVLLPDNTLLANYATDGLGNFTLPNWSMLLGNNLFTATAYGTDGSSASAQLNLIGNACPTPIPGSLLLLGSGLLGLVGLRKKLFG